MAKHNDLGKWGEEIAFEKLTRDGYAIVAQNWKLGHYEIDIIATKGTRIVFVEVKTRSNDFTDPIDAVDRRKMAHMCASANAYMKEAKVYLEAQFDIIGITGVPGNYTVQHIEDAFIPPLKTYR